ncbi:hypothetical protein MKK63_08175, partial [Methylobacterium sp. J-088]|nr:hypothetical protein [Methylobacterium sp. J-088]
MDHHPELHVNKKDASYRAHRGLTYGTQRQRKESMENSQRASTIAPNNPVARAGLGRGQGGVGSLFN